MLVTEYFTIAKFALPSSWVALIIALIAAYLIMRFKYGKRISEVFSDALFYFILVWKFSYILTDFTSVIKLPLSIIYFHGGLVGFYLGLLAACTRVIIVKKKKGFTKTDHLALFTGVVSVQVVYQIMMVLLNEGELIAQIVTVIGFTLFGLYTWLSLNKEKSSLTQFALLFMAVHFFIAAFQRAGIFDTPVISTFVLSLFIVIFLFISHETELED